MRLICLWCLLAMLAMTNLAFGAATVFMKDGSKEVGNSAWQEGNSVYLNKGGQIYEFAAEEILLEETLKASRIGKYAETATVDATSRVDGSKAGDDVLDRIFAGSSIDRQINQLMEQFSAGALSSAAGNVEMGEMLSRSLSGFDAKKAITRFRAYYRTHVDAKSLEAVAAWTGSPLGKKIRELELARAANSSEAARQVMNGQGLMESLPVQRRTLIKELDKSSQSTEIALQLVSDSITAVMGAFPAKTPEQKQARKEFEQQIGETKVVMATQLRSVVQASLANTYQDLTDDELMGYIEFLHTEPARKFTRATKGAMGELTKNLASSMMKNLVRMMEQMGGEMRQM